MTILLSLIFTPKIVGFICGAIWARLNGYMTPIFVNVTGREHIDKKQSYVVVSNHQSQYDIFVLYGWLGIDIKWVMKKELRKIPGLGIGSKKVGHIFIDRSDSQAALETINTAKKNIVNGTSIIFFPEGTRSRTGELTPFKKGAFRLAIDLKLPILPITITGTRNILPSGTIDLFPGKAKMLIHKPIDIKGYNNDNFSDLMDVTYRTIKSGIS